MPQLTVVSPHADALRRHLSTALPETVAARFFHSARDVDAEALQAEIAFGAPDELAQLLLRMPALRWLQSTWAGVTPLLAVPRQDYMLTGVKGLFAQAMSEYVLGWLLALDRRIPGYASARQWRELPARKPQRLRVGIAGVGSIGAGVAAHCAAFYGEVVGLNSDGRDVPGCVRCYPSAAVADFARGLDALVMLLPDTPATTGLVDARVLAQLNPGAVLLNAGRANSLDMPGALTALESGALSALVLDVLEQEPLPEADPLWDTPGAYISCHTAALTESAAISRLFLDNLAAYLGGAELQGRIDFQRGY